jgi:outer membrane protein assembly factor BamB
MAPLNRAFSRARVIRVAVAAALLGASFVVLPASAALKGGCGATYARGGGDWPMLGGNAWQTNYQAAERVLGAANVGQLKLAWASGPTVNPGQSTPSVAGSCVYFSGDGIVYALDADTGRFVWRAQRSLKLGGDGGLTYQPMSVTITNGRVHVDAANGNRPTGNAFDARTGKWLWSSPQVTFGYQATQLSSPKVIDGIHLLFTTGPDFNPHGRPGYALLDEKTGKVLAKHTTIPDSLLKQGYSGGGVWATAAVDPVSKYAFVGTSNPYTKTKESPYDNAIIKIDMNRRRSTFGQIVQVYKGIFDAPAQQIYNQPECQIVGGAAPAVVGLELVCSQQDADFAAGPTLFRNKHGRLMLAELQKDGTLHVLDAQSMSPDYRELIGLNNNLEGTGGNAAEAAFDGKRLYVVANPGTLYALDPDTGNIEWAVPFQDNSASYRPVVAANGVVYTIAAFDSTIIAHDAATGRPLAALSPSMDTGNFCSGGSTGGLAIAHHMLFINCGGYVAAYGLPKR